MLVLHNCLQMPFSSKFNISFHSHLKKELMFNSARRHVTAQQNVNRFNWQLERFQCTLGYFTLACQWPCWRTVYAIPWTLDARLYLTTRFNVPIKHHQQLHNTLPYSLMYTHLLTEQQQMVILKYQMPTVICMPPITQTIFRVQKVREGS